MNTQNTEICLQSLLILFSINFQVTIDFSHSDWSRFAVSEVMSLTSDYSFLIFTFLYSNEFEVNFCRVLLIFIHKHLEIYTKTYRLVITSPLATNC